MSTSEVCEANEALGDVGDSGGCPGEGRGLLCLRCVGLDSDSKFCTGGTLCGSVQPSPSSQERVCL